ncbi:hypothetical protein Pmar_PMAR023411 [Perkinsus marinus ATCC 50983]|uniref:Uncharacterized protein n=1 Tax=Perkinsus marinus (strain ATCC 50983 / TXsc) TaxID=423536 RepID=C5KKH4_PERM5|nr:hypothetical protein Pmar_PMAR023411 [Perkinsus marinus ATCC 50983]EER15086.1 hypothetical protein Pmar_PMAR023411 [Perkinsus marinus ATCC 50983]|eukprot:XP_002783290.1 hypothetical protein Pmar_PMAR023411 [Perkinsus marinus ATCC 50983]
MSQLGGLLYQEKYTHHNPDAVTYLKNHWFTGSFCQGVSVRYPSTNNGVEPAIGKAGGLD